MRALLRPRDEDTEARVLAAIGAGFDSGFSICEDTGLSAGCVYPALARLERSGQITARWEPDPGERPPRRLYSIARRGVGTTQPIGGWRNRKTRPA